MNFDPPYSFPGFEITEQLGETHHSSVFRARKKGWKRTVIIKVLRSKELSAEQIARFQYEYELIRGIKINGIIKPIDLISCDGMPALVLEDFGGVSLKQIITDGLSTERFLKLAIRLSQILGELHQANISHRDIKPSNILWNRESDILKITDFGISEIFQLNNELTNPHVIEGTLAYISPEQTGRMNCGVDYRTDLYSLGVTFYEMLTGRVPFKSKDPMEIIHAHIAKLPTAPEKHRPEISEAISDIIMKLLSKPVDKRYQNSFGLMADLKECLRRLQINGRIEPFGLGSKDISLRFTIPHLLVGRDKELDLLYTAFDRVSSDTAEMVLVTGEPGIGKSALINEIHKPIAVKQGYFLIGKFDQFLRTVPYSAIIQVFQSLARNLLSETSEQLQRRKRELLAALGPNGKIITDIIPEIEVIIGKQPDIPELGPQETQNRFDTVFKNFVRILADRNHPLVLFLDDLQWADSASLNLIETILTDKNLRFLLFVGAYRETEITAHHPFMLTRENIERAGMTIHNIRLGALDLEAVNQLIVTMTGHSFESSLLFAQAIHEKTKGSPFFIHQFLKTLYEKKYLWFDPGHGWTWDLRKIQEMQATENVVTFMADRLHELPSAFLQILQICACIGGRFDLETLMLITKQSSDEIYAIIDVLIRKELILRKRGYYQFYHDRIQEAAYSMLSPKEREQFHYQIGKLDLERTSDGQLFNRIFYICDQLNQAVDCLAGQKEQIRLAELNLKAGIKAKESTAYSAAVQYLTVGSTLLPENAWHIEYELTFALLVELMECQYLDRNFEAAEELFEIIIANAQTKIDKARAYRAMVVLYTNTRTASEAIELGLKALKIFGMKYKRDVGPIPVIVELIKVKRMLKKIGIENVISLPVSHDQELIARHQLMARISTSAYYVNPNLYALMNLEGVKVALKYGLMPPSSLSFIAMANIIQTITGDYKLAFQIGEMALKLNERFNNLQIAGVLLHIFAFFLNHWQRHLKTELTIYPKVFELSMNAGNFIYAGHSINCIVHTRILLGHQLDDILNEIKKYNDFMVLLKDPLIVDQFQLSAQSIKALKGLTTVRYDLSDASFNLDEKIAQLRKKGNFFGLCYMLNTKVFFLLMYRRYEEAYSVMKELDKYIKVPMGTILVSYHYLYYSLILIALLKKGGYQPKRNFKILIRRNQRRLRKWAKLCPENFKHQYDLVQAERAVLNGRFKNAVKYYHLAIAGARKNGFFSVEASACELLGAFYLSRNYGEEGGLYIRKSYQIYLSWGATAKADDLKEHYPDLFPIERRMGSTEQNSAVTSSQSTSSRNLDFSTVMQVSQVISSEIMLDRLLVNVMHLSVVNAGAERGYLILESEGNLKIQASEDVVTGEKQVLQNQPLETFQTLSPAVVNFVYHSGKPLILGNAAGEGDFMNDPHVVENNCKSILCMPLMNKGMLMGILYMENNLTAGVFTAERLEILRVISSQAAISIQNARLYKDITTEIMVRKHAEEGMRESEQKYRTILEEMQDVYCETDLNGKITFINPAVCAITGYSQAELIGSNIKKGLRSAEQKSVEWYFHEIYVTGMPGKPLSCDFNGKNGKAVFLEIVASPIRDKSNKIIGYRNVGRDVSERKRLENDLHESYKNVQNARMATILGLAKLAEYRDEETGSHLERMREYALVIARELAKKSKYQDYITPDYIEDIYNSAILHDIGKVGVPDAILLKPGKLTPDEFEKIKTHATLGGDALRAIEAKIQGQTFLTLSKEIAYYHHERWDGSGYPEGLKGDEIPLSARIVALADVYDALTSKRVYKEAFSHEKAMDIIIKDRGTHFAPDIVDAFLVHQETFRRIRQELQGE